jgi:phospholipase/carboxylesterase
MKLPLAHIWQPARTPSRQLLVVLHGLGDSAKGFIGLQNVLAIDTLNCLLLTAPEPYYSGFRWYDIEKDAISGVVNSRKILASVFEAIADEGYAPEQTMLLGFSQGCLMTLEFGARFDKRLAGYIGISGYSLNPVALLRELNPDVNHGGWLITHGTRDDVLPVETTRAQIQILREGGFEIDYREYPKAHTIDLNHELPEIRVWIQQRMKQQSD